MDLFQKPKEIEDVFCKRLATNDDSGRHGVLIPVFAYHLFPRFENFHPDTQLNYEEKIITFWPQLKEPQQTKESKWKHYHRYPERRMTCLQPELLNLKPNGSLLMVAKYNNEYQYECFVITPESEHYTEVGSKFKLNRNDEDGYFEGAAIIPFSQLVTSHEERTPLDELIEHFERINSLGFVKTMRNGDTGVGFTFEELMGISANSNKEPDYKGIEIKCSRSKQSKKKRRSPTGKQTLFSLVPNWSITENRRNLVEEYGEYDAEKDRISIYSTIKVIPNPKGWNLEIAEGEDRIYVCYKGKRVVFYDMDTLCSSLESKHKESIFITAETRKSNLGTEEFYYDSVVHCREVMFSEYIALIKENLAGLDFAIHLKDGKVRDHGFLWRIDSKKYLLRLFKYVQELK